MMRALSRCRMLAALGPLAAVLFVAPSGAIAQNGGTTSAAPLHSVVIRSDSARNRRATATGRTRSIMDTVTSTLGRLESHVTVLAPGMSPHAPHRHVDEELIIVVHGTLDVSQEGVTRRANQGSVIFQASNELHGMRNVGPDTASYYVVRFDPRPASDVASAVASQVAAGGAAADPAVVARSFLSGLPDSNRTLAALPFDSTTRTAWNFVPMDRLGVPLGRITPSQRLQVDALLGTSLGAEGMAKAHRIIQHESILRDIEQAAGVANFARRDPNRYFTAVFGTPARDSVWGWRFEGHHLSVNVTQIPGESPVAAPLFMGANPARVPSGPHAGLRILAAEEDLARALVQMLPADRRRQAMLADTTFGEIVTRNDPKARPLALEGLPAASMSPAEQQQLRRLLDIYASRLTTAAARDQLARIERAGFGRLHFAWAGSLDVGKAHYYRIHGPTLLIEYDNTQNNANHVHTVWRDLERDFGGDLLRAHYRKHKH